MATATADTRLEAIEPALIEPNPYQPRQTVDPEGIEKLAADIKEDGLRHPIVVRPHPEAIEGVRRYQLAEGQRRLAAVRLLVERDEWRGGIEARIRDYTDEQLLLTSLAENNMREDVNPIEEIRAIRTALDTIPGLRAVDVARALGVSKSQVSNRLALLKLPKMVQDLVATERMGWTAARELVVLTRGECDHSDVMQEFVEYLCRFDPPFTVENVINRLYITCRDSKHLRSLDGLQEWENRSVVLDVSKFAKNHTTHRIKTGRHGSDSHARVTCDIEEFDALQKKAGELRTTPWRNRDGKVDQWVTAMMEDPAVKRVAPEFSHENPEFTDEQRTALGVRATRTPLLKNGWNQELTSDRGWARLPRYFDKTECVNTCKKGAYYGEDWDGMTLTCSLKSCFEKKLQDGFARLHKKFSKTMEHANARQTKLAGQLPEVIQNGPAIRALGRLMLESVTRTLPTNPDVDHSDFHYEVERREYFPDSSLRAAERLGFERDQDNTDRILWNREGALTAYDTLSDAAAAAVAYDLLANALDGQGLTVKHLNVGELLRQHSGPTNGAVSQ